jgi:hypothetical protein
MTGSEVTKHLECVGQLVTAEKEAIEQVTAATPQNRVRLNV